MLLDNENDNFKVHEWITKYTAEGKMDIVTGYFTVGALDYLSEQMNDKIAAFRMVLGDIVNFDATQEKALDLLNENITIDAAFKLSKVAKSAVNFLKQDKVKAKTLEPNFCHAKAYIFDYKERDPRSDYFITGSSNLTEAGIGKKHTSNIELNIAGFGSEPQYKELKGWFEELWIRPQAHEKKTLVDENGKKEYKDFKQYLIEEIEKIFYRYSPNELYYKVLFELFGSQLLLDEQDPHFAKQVGRLENTVIYQTLYEFQKKGVLSLILMLQKYNGAILADAVGLGKTWSALAVMKYFELEGRRVILLCPKKLENNWRRYLRKQDSRFEKDNFDYILRFHTDLQEGRFNKYNDVGDNFFQDDKPKLFVIDESHNLRNDKSNRYKYFLEEILQKNEDVKVLMLSATPINNSLADIRNQFKLPVRGNPKGYEESLGIRNLDYTFRRAQKAFNEWRQEEEPKISEFIKTIPANFFKLTDSLIVARTRKMIEGQQSGLTFPKKAKPINLFVTPSVIGNFDSFEELFNHLPPKLSGYQPSFYAQSKEEKKEKAAAKKKGEVSVLEDEQQREFFLVKMMTILMVKRLESSWLSFYETVKRIKDHHQNALNRIQLYEKTKKNLAATEDDSEAVFGDDDDLITELDQFTLGKKRKVSLKDIDEAGNISLYKRHLKADIKAMVLLIDSLRQFEETQQKELEKKNNHRSVDDKLEELIRQIKKKRQKGGNQKVIIFTVYRDTAFYLFEQLTARGFDKIAAISGSGAKTDDIDGETKKFEPLLERFTPFTKLFREKEWINFSPSATDLSPLDAYEEWKDWIAENDVKTHQQLENPIDILIATDALSEGQNLQDADMVINYDIHWNPVRVIQRMGRIDRIGSPNKRIYGINFWPSDNINKYLDLQGRIEQRMAAMKLAGSEVDMEFSDSFKEIAEDDALEAKQKSIMLEQMAISFDDIDGGKSFGFDDLSLEQYRQDLLAELNQNKDYYQNMPKGVYTGFRATGKICPENGIIALLGYPTKPPKKKNHIYTNHDLIYINGLGKEVLLNQKEILDALTFHKDKNRFVPAAVDKGEEQAIQGLVDALNNWLAAQIAEEEIQADGSIKKKAGKAGMDILNKLKAGGATAIKSIKNDKTITDKYKPENFDLIAWFLIN